MQLSLITPIRHLEFTDLLPGRFCLANVANRDKYYLEYFEQASGDGYEVVLDNGTFEEELVEDDVLLDMAVQIEPTVLVIPDLMNRSSRENFEYALAFVNKHKPQYELMFVPQCARDEDSSTFQRILVNAIECDSFQWIGINRNMCYNILGAHTQTANENVNKLLFGMWASERGILQLAAKKNIRFHLLGIGSDFRLLQFMWWVNRADTASLFFQGALSNRMSSCGVLENKVSRPYDFFLRDFHLNNLQKADIVHNCRRASEYSTAATRLRRQIKNERI